MRLTPNLAFGGQCESAFKFYERCSRARGWGGMATVGEKQVPFRWESESAIGRGRNLRSVPSG
jgi:hypothetical protein